MIKSFKKKIEISYNRKMKEEGNNKNCDQQNPIEIKKYPSSDIMLDIILDEYKNEIDRGRSFDTRAGMFLPFIGAIIIFLPELTSRINWNKKNTTIMETIPYILVFILLIIALLVLVISSINFIKVLKSKEYERINYTNLNRKSAAYPEDSIKVKLIEEYTNILNVNIKANNDKAKYYKYAMIQVQYSLFVITAIITISMFIS